MKINFSINSKVMIDNFKLSLPMEEIPKEVLSMSNESFYKGEYLFVPDPDIYTGEILSYKATSENVYLKIYSDKIYINNSIHKYYRGNNFTDFHYSDLKDAIYILSEELKEPNIQRANIRSMEVGCNINCNPQEELSKWMTFRGRFPEPSYDSQNILRGQKFRSTQYTIKGYDKSYEVKHNDNISMNEPTFRYEVNYRYMRYYNSLNKDKPIETIKDLLNPLRMAQLVNYTMKQYDTIQKKMNSLAQMNSREIQLDAFMQSREHQEALKNFNADTYKRARLRYSKLLKRIDKNNDNNNATQLKSKFIKLLES